LWVIGGIVALAGALCYAELGAAFPQAGGDYVYLREAYGPLAGFLSGWASLTIGFGAAIAASSASFAAYFLRVVPLAQENSLIAKGLSLLLLWTLTLVHAQGIIVGGTAQRLLTTTKVAAIMAFLVGGLAIGRGSWTHLTMATTDTAPTAGAIAVALVFIGYTYLGWNVAGYIAAEIAEPSRTLPRVIIGGTMLVAVLYLSLNLMYLFALPVAIMAQPPVLPVAERAATALWGAASGRFVAAVLCASIAGAVSAMVWAGPRVYWAMARDGVFASWFSTVHPRTGAPGRAIVLQSLWASVLILTGTFEQLVIYGGLVLAVFTALTVSTVFPLRRGAHKPVSPFRAPFFPIPPLLFSLFSLLVVVVTFIQRPLESAFGALTIAAGLPLYWYWRRQASRPPWFAPPLSKTPTSPSAPPPP
jgi:APA family basic amino acid/polyamine antiporter